METGGSLPAGAQGVVRAAEYVRMSTEHQQYSTQNQIARIPALCTFARPAAHSATSSRPT